jgi:hypothetical protein
MDIHPPKRPIASVREFLLEIFTVTCGIVIALGLEGAVHARDARHLARQTRDDFMTEVSANRATIAQRLAGAKADQALLLSLIEDCTKRLAHQLSALPPTTLGRDFTALPLDAWQTALATRGIGELDHPTVRALSAAYDAQGAFNTLLARSLDEWLAVAAYGDIATDTDAQARQALEHLRIGYGLAVSMVQIEKNLDQLYGKAQNALRDAQ